MHTTVERIEFADHRHLPGAYEGDIVVSNIGFDGISSHYYTDRETGLRVRTETKTDYSNGDVTATTVTVLSTNEATGTNLDLLIGNTYEAGNISVGAEISPLDDLTNTHNQTYVNYSVQPLT